LLEEPDARSYDFTTISFSILKKPEQEKAEDAGKAADAASAESS
jgi:hypothetical protein